MLGCWDGRRRRANLAHRERMEDLRYRMMQMLRDEQDPRALGEAAIFDTYKYVGARNKGYETWLKAQEEKLAAELKAKLEAGPAKKARKKEK